jgi:transcriptional regulator with XRE-family HTH domain
MMRIVLDIYQLLFYSIGMPNGVLDQLRDMIEQGDISRYRIARDTGIDQAALSRFVHGQTGLNFTTIETLAEYLGLEIIIRPKRRPKGR